VDWTTAAAAGAFVAGIVFGSVMTIRLTRAVWDGAVRARRDLEDDTDPQSGDAP